MDVIPRAMVAATSHRWRSNRASCRLRRLRRPARARPALLPRLRSPASPVRLAFLDVLQGEHQAGRARRRSPARRRPPPAISRRPEPRRPARLAASLLRPVRPARRAARLAADRAARRALAHRGNGAPPPASRSSKSRDSPARRRRCPTPSGTRRHPPAPAPARPPANTPPVAPPVAQRRQNKAAFGNQHEEAQAAKEVKPHQSAAAGQKRRSSATLQKLEKTTGKQHAKEVNAQFKATNRSKPGPDVSARDRPATGLRPPRPLRLAPPGAASRSLAELRRRASSSPSASPRSPGTSAGSPTRWRSATTTASTCSPAAPPSSSRPTPSSPRSSACSPRGGRGARGLSRLRRRAQSRRLLLLALRLAAATRGATLGAGRARTRGLTSLGHGAPAPAATGRRCFRPPAPPGREPQRGVGLRPAAPLVVAAAGPVAVEWLRSAPVWSRR